MHEVGGSSRSWDRVLQTGSFLAAWVVAGLLARLAVPEGQSLALIWPAAGVAVLWFLIRRATWRSVDAVLLTSAAFIVNYATGISLETSSVMAVGNTIQTVVAVWCLRRWCPGLWG